MLRRGSGWFLLAALFTLSFSPGRACTVPVFRYALDNWPGTTDPEVKDSPVIEEIAKLILAGNSAVWIQIDSGNQAEDDAVFERLQGRLKFFESVAQLPEIDPNDPSNRMGPGPELALKFAAFRVKRSDPVSQLLTGPKTDSLPPGEAWLAPVFGRGRVLGAWEASRMDEEGIDEACFYLTGACSCQAKLQNPGWDLVMNVAWDERLRALDSVFEAEEDAPDKPEKPKVVAPAEEAQFTPIFKPTTTDLNFTPVLGVILLIIGALLFVKRRKPKT